MSDVKRKRLSISAAAIVVAVAVVAGAFWPGEKEPEYQGKKLSEWTSRGPLGDADDAVLAIGTNALPFLVKWISYDSPPLKTKLLGAAWKINHRFSNWLYEKTRAKLDRRENAIWAFDILGPRASPAISDLVGCMKHGSTNVAEKACYILTRIGDAAVPALFDILTNSAAYPHLYVYPSTFGQLLEGPITNKAALVPVLVTCLEDKRPQVAANAASMLGSLKTDPTISVPALARMLDHEDEEVRYRAVCALAEFGSEARSAVPSVLRFLDRPTVRLGHDGAFALGKIAPDILKDWIAKRDAGFKAKQQEPIAK